MTLSEQIKILCVRSNISVSALARKIGQSPQVFNVKMKRESFTLKELKEMAEVVEATFERVFILFNEDKR